MTEGATANGREPYHYLHHVFSDLPAARTEAELLALLRTNLTPAQIAPYAWPVIRRTPTLGPPPDAATWPKRPGQSEDRRPNTSTLRLLGCLLCNHGGWSRIGLIAGG